VLVGNNEDDNNPFTRVWFMPGANGKLARMYVGFDNLWPQGGMNERGLWFDGFATAPIEATRSTGKPDPPPYFLDKVMSECGTVQDVINVFDRYNLSFLRKAVLMYADASGESVIIEPDAMIRKKGRYQVQTNFHQSLPKPEYECARFRVANRMLQEAVDDISVDLSRRILAAAHSETEYPTVYSNVYDLKRRVMYLYLFHNHENVVTLDLAAELKKGTRVLEMAALFPRNAAAEAYSKQRAKELNRVQRTAIPLDPKLLDEYAGKYSLEGVSTVTILREGAEESASPRPPTTTAESAPESPRKYVQLFLCLFDAASPSQ
jgi:hypothetical protein